MNRVTVASWAFVPVLFMTASTAMGQSTPLTSCGETITSSRHLVGDLDCTGINAHGVAVRGSATLELRGFSIRNAENDGVECFANCRVVGPGSITGTRGVAISGRVRRVENVTISGNGFGVSGDRFALVNSTVTGNRGGLHVGVKGLIVGSAITGNGMLGIRAGRVDGTRRGDVCLGSRLIISDSILADNDGHADCGVTETCVDIESCRKPVLDEASSCETSSNSLAGGSWGVCSAD